VSAQLLRQGSRFIVTGALATAIHAAIAIAFMQLIAPAPALANGCAFAMATLFSYLGNTLWSFSSSIRARTFLRFLAVSAGGCLLAMGVAGAADAAGWNYLVGILLVVCVVPPVTFVAHRRWTYRVPATGCGVRLSPEDRRSAAQSEYPDRSA
jgi:putative flippase GtrA